MKSTKTNKRPAETTVKRAAAKTKGRPKTKSSARRIRSSGKVDTLTIIIKARSIEEGSDIGIGVFGDEIEKIFDNGDQMWTDIKGAVHSIVGAIGMSRYGREVEIMSYDPYKILKIQVDRAAKKARKSKKMLIGEFMRSVSAASINNK